MKKLTIYSGIEPGKKGAGKYVQYFIEKIKTENIDFQVVSVGTPEGQFVQLLKKTPFFNTIKQLYYLLNNYSIKRNKTKSTKIVLFHPQSLGITRSIKLINKSIESYIYIFDNFFFCVKSYNHLNNQYNECTECLKNVYASKKNECKPYPVKLSNKQYADFLSFLNTNLDKITFLTQNNKQSELLRTKFPSNLKMIEIGMNTNEIDFNEDKNCIDINDSFLYHGTLNYSKGLLYFIELSKNLLDFEFIIPYSKQLTSNYLNISIFPSNIRFIDCSWDNGLKELCKTCKVTIVPSLWSAPIEGALIKSLYFSPNVACVQVNNSFANELPDDIVIKLSSNISLATNTLKNIIQNNTFLNTKASNWVIDLYNKNEQSHINFINTYLL